MTRHASVALLLVLGGACRIGGPNGEATTLIEVDARQSEVGSEPVADARPADPGIATAQTADAASAGPAIDDDAATGNDAATGDAAVLGDTSVGGGAIGDAVTPSVDAPLADCVPPPDLECDPVSGEGCLPFMQCLADPTSSSPAAYCVFSSLLLDATCTQDELSTDCPPQHTCVMGLCREYCYCDADCENGAACGAPSEEGSTRFRLCES